MNKQIIILVLCFAIVVVGEAMKNIGCSSIEATCHIDNNCCDVTFPDFWNAIAIINMSTPTYIGKLIFKAAVWIINIVLDIVYFFVVTCTQL